VIVFSGAALDRAPALRRRPGWLEARRADPAARAVLMSERGVLLDDGRLLLEPPGPEAVFLGLMDGTPLFADHVDGAEPHDSGHERVCRTCRAHHFPRTDPVVIVRVTDGGDGLLLGRQARWRTGASPSSPATSSRGRRSRRRCGGRCSRSPGWHSTQ
jgi:hypothetical protein